MDDVTQIFFKNISLNSRLANLGQQQLTTNLDEAREGTEHNYMVLGNANTIIFFV